MIDCFIKKIRLSLPLPIIFKVSLLSAPFNEKQKREEGVIPPLQKNQRLKEPVN